MARPAPAPIDVPFGALDTKGDPTSLPPGTLTQAENATALQGNAYTTRRGYSQLTAGPSSAVAALQRQGNLAVIDGQMLWPYDATAGVWPARPYGQVPEAQVRKLPINRDLPPDQPPSRPSVATATNGVTVIAWIAGLQLIVSCHDPAGNTIFGPQALDTADPSLSYVNIRAVAVGNTLVVLGNTQSGGGPKIRAVRCDATVRPLVWSAGTAVSSAVAGSNNQLDASALGTSSIVAIWQNNTGILTALIDPTSLATTATLGQAATLTSASGMAIMGTPAENIYAAWWDSAAGVKVWVLTTVLASVAGPTVVTSYVATSVSQIGLSRVDSTHALLAWQQATSGQYKLSTGATRDRVRWARITNGAVASSITDLPDLSLVGKPFAYNGNSYLHVMFDSTLSATQASNFLIRVSPDGTIPANARVQQLVAMDEYRQAKRDTTACALTDMVQATSGIINTALLAGVKYLSSDTAISSVDLITFDFTNPRRFISNEIGQMTLMTGGVGTEYDGSIVEEIGFLTYPEGFTATPFTSGGSMADGTYQYILIYEASDALGNVHQSTTSAALSVTIAGGGGAGRVVLGSIPNEILTSLRGPDAGVTNSLSNVFVSVFRTTPSVDVGIFHHTASYAMVIGAAATTLNDTNSDSTLSTKRQLYTTGSVLDKEPPLPSTMMITHQNAVWGISSEDQQLLFYSGDYLPGVAPWFSSGFQIRCDTGGPITAIASLDDKVIIFKSDRIFYVSGQRPNATGTNSSLSAPQLVSTDVGCIEPRSIVRTGEGVYFLSAKGIYLLDRGLNVSYIGAPVEGYVNGYTNCVGASLLPDRQEIRWEFTGPIAPMTVARKIVYNYFLKRWTTHLNYNSLVPVTAVGGYGLPYTWFTSAGVAYQELAASAQQVDPSSTFISLLLQTGWLAPTGPQGLTRCQYLVLLASHFGQHGIEIEVARNYVDVYTMATLYPNSVLALLPNDQISYNLPQQQGESYRAIFQTYADPVPGSYDRSITASGLRLVALAKRGTFNKFQSATAKA